MTFQKQLSVLLLGVATAAGCVDQGDQGEIGETGETGEMGTACWDLDTNSTCDVESEDKDKNGTCDVSDCAANGEGYILNSHGNAEATQTASFSIQGSGTIAGGETHPALSLQSTGSWQTGATSHHVLEMRGGTPERTYTWMDNFGGLVASGRLGIGSIPTQGSGERMMWFPFKASFRVGSVNTEGLFDGAEWDDANMGFYSFASGVNTVADGLASFAVGDRSHATNTGSVAMGMRNISEGTASFAVGSDSKATGYTAVAMGRKADAAHNGSMVFADWNPDLISSTTANQFTFRAAGGIRLFTNASASTGVYLTAGGSGWNVVSDRNAKTSFQPIDGEDLLSRLANVEVSNWVYKEEVGQPRHIGPMAQDFYAAFGLGTEDTRVNSLDLDGVNMAAVQALEIRTRELAHTTREVAELKNEVQSLRADIERLEKLVIAQQQLAGVAR